MGLRHSVTLSMTITLFASGVTGCSSSNGAAAAPEKAGAANGAAARGPGIPVTVGTAVQKAMPLELRVIGTAEAFSNVAVRAQVTGELNTVNFKEGDDVKQGQVLFELDRRPLEGALKQADANLARDLAQAGNAEAQAKRYDDLAARGIATREQVDTAAANRAALEATVGADRAAIENARVQ